MRQENFYSISIHTIVNERLVILESYYEVTYLSGWLPSARGRLRLDKTAILRETGFPPGIVEPK